MNEYTKRFVLLLIKRRMHKHEVQAWRRLSKEPNGLKRRTANLTEYMENKEDYAKLIELKANIEGINNFWQGMFAPYWTRDPKNLKYIEQLPEIEDRPEPTKNEFFDNIPEGMNLTDEVAIDNWIKSYMDASDNWTLEDYLDAFKKRAEEE